jgi:hypothetical protein
VTNLGHMLFVCKHEIEYNHGHSVAKAKGVAFHELIRFLLPYSNNCSLTTLANRNWTF